MAKKQAAKAELPSGVFELSEEALEQVIGGNKPHDTGLQDGRTGREVYAENKLFGRTKVYTKKEDGSLEEVNSSKVQWKVS